jgi:hypothetical protein
MKKNNTSFWILPILVILLAACTTTKAEKVDQASENVQNSQDDLDRANKNYAKEVALYRTSVESDLRENKLEIAKLQDQKTGLKEDVLAFRNEKIAVLRKRNDELELRMRQYRGDNNEHWKEFRHEFDADMSELEKSLKDFEKDNVK